MKILIEEKDETMEYSTISPEQYKEAVKEMKDRYELYIPNACGGESRITIFKEVEYQGPLTVKEADLELENIRKRIKK